METFYNKWSKTQLSDPRYIQKLEWKGKNLATLIQRNNLDINSIAEIGGGVGAVISTVRELLNIENADNYELTDFFIKEGQKRYKHIHFIKKDLLKEDIDNDYDMIILSDIIEHFEDDIRIIKKALQHSQYVVLKIPIEKFLFTRFFEFIGMIDEIGVDHSAGHLHRYSVSSVWNLFKGVDVEIIDFFFDRRNPNEDIYYKRKQLNFVQKVYRKFKFLFFLSLHNKQYCKIFGGSLFILLKNKGLYG